MTTTLTSVAPIPADVVYVDVESVRRHAEALVETLVDEGPATGAELREWLGWSRGRLTVALRFAREQVCPELELAIPTPTPDDGWRYRVTTEWQPVQRGANYSLGQVESRLRGLARDVGTVLPHLEPGSLDWRRANFLNKHLGHLIGTLDEINGTR